MRLLRLSGALLIVPQTSNSYFICNDPRIIDAIFARLRNYVRRITNLSVLVHLSLAQNGQKSGADYPKNIAGTEITSVVDLTTGYDSTNPPTYQPSMPLSSGHMIQFRGELKSNGTKIVLTIRYVDSRPTQALILIGKLVPAGLNQRHVVMNDPLHNAYSLFLSLGKILLGR